MKKILGSLGATLMVLASFVPMASVKAADQVDTLTVTVNPACSINRISVNGVANSSASVELVKEISLGGVDNNFGTVVYNVTCNKTGSYGVTETFTPLHNASLPNNTKDITYSVDDPTAGSGTWTATVTPATGASYNLNPNATGANVSRKYLIYNTGVTPSGGISATVTYKVSVFADQPAGTYQGSASYVLADV